MLLGLRSFQSFPSAMAQISILARKFVEGNALQSLVGLGLVTGVKEIAGSVPSLPGAKA